MLGGRIKEQIKPKVTPVLEEIKAMATGKPGASDREQPVPASWLPRATRFDLCVFPVGRDEKYHLAMQTGLAKT